MNRFNLTMKLFGYDISKANKQLDKITSRRFRSRSPSYKKTKMTSSRNKNSELICMK